MGSRRKAPLRNFTEASKLVAMSKGCCLYITFKKDTNSNRLHLTEICDSKEHDNSLKIETVAHYTILTIKWQTGGKYR